MSRIASIVLANAAQTITLPVTDAKPDDLYILTGADGLGPTEIEVSIGQSVYRGGVFQGSAPRDREIVLLIGLNPSYSKTPPESFSKLRSAFYKLMSGEEYLTLTINNRSTNPGDFIPDVMKTLGYIRRIETIPFVKDPQVQVTIACPSPVFEAPSITDIPFTPNMPVSTPFIFDYDGTAIVGFEWWFETTTTSTSPTTLKSTANNGVSEILTIPGSRVSGEMFQINTMATSRKVNWRNPAISGEYMDITGMCVVSSGHWPSIHPGANRLEISNGAGLPCPVITRLLRYTAKYWGV